MARKESSAEMLSAYLDEELDQGEREAFESLLEASPQTRAELEALRQVVSLVGNLPPVAAPEDFYERLSKRLRRRQAGLGGGPLMTLISLPFQVLSTLVILAVATLYLMTQLEQAPSTLERATRPPTAEPSDASDAGAPTPPR